MRDSTKTGRSTRRSERRGCYIDLGESSDVALSVTVDRNGRILVVGPTIASSWEAIAVARLLPTGELDGTFGTDDGLDGDPATRSGKATIDLGVDTRDLPVQVAVDAVGNIILGGMTFRSTNSELAVVRLLGNGDLDATFGMDDTTDADPETRIGWQTVSLLSTGGWYYGGNIAIDSFGRVLVVGHFVGHWGYHEPTMRVARLTIDGQRDTTFGQDGVAGVYWWDPTDDGTYGVHYIGYDGRIITDDQDRVIVGAQTGSRDFAIARLTRQGAMDSSFGLDGQTPIWRPGSCRTLLQRPRMVDL